MRGIENADNVLGFDVGTLSCLRLIQDLSNGLLAFPVRLCQVLDRLSFPDMFAPYLVGKLLYPALAAELQTAIQASVILYSSASAVLLYACILTVRTLFLRMVCS